MQSDELFPCRFCGHLPTIKTNEFKTGIIIRKKIQEYGIICLNCHHAAEYRYQQSFSDTKYAWQARNEKHNPFIKENNHDK